MLAERSLKVSMAKTGISKPDGGGGGSGAGGGMSVKPNNDPERVARTIHISGIDTQVLPMYFTRRMECSATGRCNYGILICVGLGCCYFHLFSFFSRAFIKVWPFVLQSKMLQVDMVGNNCEQILGDARTSRSDVPASDCVRNARFLHSYGFEQINRLFWWGLQDDFSLDHTTRTWTWCAGLKGNLVPR